mgnify:CR=1 FL=1
MSNTMRWMMEIEEFCDKLFLEDHNVDDVLKDVELYFQSKEAAKYAKHYLLSTR